MKSRHKNSETGCAVAFRISKRQWDNIADRSKEKQPPEVKSSASSNERSHIAPLEKIKEYKRLRAKKYETKEFYQLRKDQVELRGKIVAEARVKASPKYSSTTGVDQGLNLAQVLYERAKQEELDELIRKEELEGKFEAVEEVRKAAEEDLRKQLAEEEAEKNKKTDFKKTCLEQIQQKNKEEEEEMKQKEEDTKIYAAIAQQLKNVELAKKMAETEEKRNRLIEQKQLLHNQRQRREQMKRDEQMQDIVNAIHLEAKEKMKHLIKQKEKEMQVAIIKRQNNAIATVKTIQDAKEEQELQKLDAAIEEFNKRADEQANHRRELRNKLRKDRLAERDELKKLEQAQINRELEMQQLEATNRIQKDVLTRKYDEDVKRKRWQEVLQYRRELEKQIEEREMAERERKLEDVERMENYMKGLSREAREFFKYGEDAVEFARRMGRPTLPVETAIKKYERENKQLLMQLQKYKNAE